VWRLRGNLLAIIVPLVLISFSLNVWQVHSDAVSSFFLPQTRFWELWMGGALAYFDIFRPDVGRRLTGSWTNLVSRFPVQEPTSSSAAIVPSILSTVGVLLICISLLLVRESAFPGWWALLPVCGAALLIVAGGADQSYDSFQPGRGVRGVNQLSPVFVALADSVVCSHHSRRRFIARRENCGGRSEFPVGVGDVAFCGISNPVRPQDLDQDRSPDSDVGDHCLRRIHDPRAGRIRQQI
jgi:hypothetical protein